MENQKSERCLSLDNFTDIANIEAEIIKLISDDLNEIMRFMSSLKIQKLQKERFRQPDIIAISSVKKY